VNDNHQSAIWFAPVTVDELNKRFGNTLFTHLSMSFTEIGNNYLVATMPVTESVHQPMGLLHGGANVALAETVGSGAANLVLDKSECYAVGQEINANHVRGVRSGMVTATATPAYIGRSSHVWEIKIVNDDNKLSCISRLTMAVVKR